MRRPLRTALFFFGAIAVVSSILFFVGKLFFEHIFPAPLHAAPERVVSRMSQSPAPDHAAAAVAAKRLASAMVANDNLPGLSIAVAVKGKLVWAEGFGWADVASQTPVTPATRFRLGSVSKSITSAAVGLLIERGLIDLDTPVQRYVPSYPEKKWPVTTRHLMAHAVGFREHGSMSRRHCSDVLEALPIFAEDPLLFEPGTAYRYSTYGWILVTATIQSVAGRPFHSFMQKEIFTPLGMGSTVPDGPAVPDRATFYFPRMNEDPRFGHQPAPAADYSCYGGAGAFVSTAADLARFGAAMMRGDFLEAETVQVLQTPFQLKNGQTTEYALGWHVRDLSFEGGTARELGHHGTPMGGTTSLMLFPDHDIAVAMATNITYAPNLASLGVRVAEVFHLGEIAPPVKRRSGTTARSGS